MHIFHCVEQVIPKRSLCFPTRQGCLAKRGAGLLRGSLMRGLCLDQEVVIRQSEMRADSGEMDGCFGQAAYALGNEEEEAVGRVVEDVLRRRGGVRADVELVGGKMMPASPGLKCAFLQHDLVARPAALPVRARLVEIAQLVDMAVGSGIEDETIGVRSASDVVAAAAEMNRDLALAGNDAVIAALGIDCECACTAAAIVGTVAAAE